MQHDGFFMGIIYDSVLKQWHIKLYFLLSCTSKLKSIQVLSKQNASSPPLSQQVFYETGFSRFILMESACRPPHQMHWKAGWLHRTAITCLTRALILGCEILTSRICKSFPSTEIVSHAKNRFHDDVTRSLRGDGHTLLCAPGQRNCKWGKEWQFSNTYCKCIFNVWHWGKKESL